MSLAKETVSCAKSGPLDKGLVEPIATIPQTQHDVATKARLITHSLCQLEKRVHDTADLRPIGQALTRPSHVRTLPPFN